MPTRHISIGRGKGKGRGKGTGGHPIKGNSPGAVVHGLKFESSEERRRKGLMALQQRRDLGDLIEVSKILKGLTRINKS